MNVWDRKILRQIENAADSTDLENACKMLIMVLKKKASYLPSGICIVTMEDDEYVVPYELLRMLLKTEPLKAKL
jgi:hypothetical protein